MTVTLTHHDFSATNTNTKGKLEQNFRATAPGQNMMIIRLRIHRDPYQEQSYAVAEVLADDRTWSTVATLHPAGWHPATRTEPDYLIVAQRLIDAVKKTFALL